ncbi:phosphoglycerate mutase-like protein [Amylostereum chailletii]|nr:phosphoglycerate mutase-like protein [Amylostereum chailletii]
MPQPSVLVTFIRHGESTDNLRSVWAGWQDAPLSNHGMNQALAVGKFFADTRFDAIYASTLKRAYSTAQAVYDGQTDPKPPFTSSPLLREQHFGQGEGHKWTYQREESLTLEEHYARGIYPVLFEDDEKFPGGESPNDLDIRANQAIEELVLPHVWDAAKTGKKGLHIAVVSHGLCISRLIAQLLKKGTGPLSKADYRGLQNTAWTRVAVDVKESQEGEPVEFSNDTRPPLAIAVTDINQHSHIDRIKRQKGGIGSAAYDPAQKDIRDFFGGKTEALAVSESNAHDEVEEPQASNL